MWINIVKTRVIFLIDGMGIDSLANIKISRLPQDSSRTAYFVLCIKP